MLLGGGGNPAAWSEVDGVARQPRFGAGRRRGVTAFAQGNDYVGVAIDDARSPSRPTLWWAPVETISNSEAGFERVYQGAGLLFSWPLALAPGATRTVTRQPRRRPRRATAPSEEAAAALDAALGGA